MERASVRRLPRPDRTVQTTLPAAAARIVRAEQSAAARVRIRLPVELQGSEFDCRRAQVMPSVTAKTCETTNTETHLPAIRRPTRWIHFAMRPHRDLSPVDLAATFSQVADEFFARIELRARWLVAIEIADQTNAERNIVQIIAVHVAGVDLASPAIAYFDLTV